MKTGARGIALIKRYEDCRLDAYRDAKGVWTIGWGHTAGVKAGDRIDQARADAALREDLAEAEGLVNSHIHAPLTQSMFDALVSLAYNAGAAPLRKSVGDHVNMRAYLSVPQRMTLYIRSGHKRLLGLARRRVAEAALFLEDGLP